MKIYEVQRKCRGATYKMEINGITNFKTLKNEKYLKVTDVDRSVQSDNQSSSRSSTTIKKWKVLKEHRSIGTTRQSSSKSSFNNIKKRRVLKVRATKTIIMNINNNMDIEDHKEQKRKRKHKHNHPIPEAEEEDDGSEDDDDEEDGKSGGGVGSEPHVTAEDLDEKDYEPGGKYHGKRFFDPQDSYSRTKHVFPNISYNNSYKTNPRIIRSNTAGSHMKHIPIKSHTRLSSGKLC